MLSISCNGKFLNLKYILFRGQFICISMKYLIISTLKMYTFLNLYLFINMLLKIRIKYVLFINSVWNDKYFSILLMSIF